MRKGATASGSIFQCIGSFLNWASELGEEWEGKSDAQKFFYIVDIISAGCGFLASVLAACSPINQATINLLIVDLGGSVVSGVGTCKFTILGRLQRLNVLTVRSHSRLLGIGLKIVILEMN